MGWATRCHPSAGWPLAADPHALSPVIDSLGLDLRKAATKLPRLQHSNPFPAGSSMADPPAITLPKSRIPAKRVYISKQYIVEKAFEALGIDEYESETADFLSDDFLGVVRIEIPPHGDTHFNEKMTFYGEPTKRIDVAIESAHAAALRHLQDKDIVFIDDSNLQELVNCRHSLVQTKFWSDAFEAQCNSYEAEMAVISLKATPPPNTVVSEIQGLTVTLPAVSATAKAVPVSTSDRDAARRGSAQRAMFFGNGASSST